MIESSNSNARRSSHRVAIFGVYALAVLAWIYAVPGWVALREKLTGEPQLAARLTGEVRAEWDKYESDRSTYKRCVETSMAAIARADSTPDLPGLVKKNESCAAALRELKAPITLAPYAGNWLSEDWVIAYIGLGALLLAHRTTSTSPSSWGRIATVTLGLYVAFDWNNFVRNFVINTAAQGRKVYSFVNWDISHSSFMLQELRCLIMMFLIALLWEHYFHAAGHVDDEIMESTGSANAELVQQVLLYRSTLLRWQTDSVLLAVVFVPFDYFFWQEIERLHDLRYFPSAMAIQLIWLTTWYLASRPLLFVSNWWQSQRLTALTDVNADREMTSLIVSTADGTTEWQLLGAAVTAGASLVVPLVRAFFQN